MEIQSAFSSGVQGFQKATENANEAAANIYARTTQNQNDLSLENNGSKATDSKIPELNQSIVDLKVAEFQAKASSNVIKTADENLGTLLDVTV